ncbi:MAG TPA: FecR domain-containing protein [Puia sp.]|nr:FecR domain-containing protein [Puia sp.]
MNPEAFKELVEQYITGSLTAENRMAFARLLEQTEYRTLLEAELEHTFMNDAYEAAEPSQRRERMNKLLREKMAAEPVSAPRVHRIHFLRRNWLRVAAAAVIILLLGGAVFYRVHTQAKKELAAAPPPTSPEIAPGHNGAILTLANGSKLVLDSLKKGKLATQGATDVLLDNDQLTYHVQHPAGGEVSYNTLTVPRGHQFQLVLPDGTKVWLNAASSLRYPTVFAGAERRVEITGEAYFEVAHNAAKPFIVKKGESETKVLGTHFNINAYDEESSLNITLLEGSVQVTKGNNSTIIKPGQQAQVGKSIHVADDVDLEEVVAWKDGKFQFGETADIKTVMRQIANWYDVDVEYKGIITNHIGGTMSRNVNLSLVLKMLETTGVVRFSVDGRSIKVMPY